MSDEPSHIELEAKTDRELLLLAVTALNSMKDHGVRIRALEDWATFAKGAWAVLGLVVTGLASLLGIHLKNGH